MTAFPEDFLQTITNVGWGGGFATLKFNAVTDSIGPGGSGIGVSWQPLGMGVPDGLLTKAGPTFNQQTTITIPGQTITTHSMDYLAGQLWMGVTTNYLISVSATTGGPPPHNVWTWLQISSGATNSGVGGLSAAEADAGGGFVSEVVTGNSTSSVTSPATTIYHNVDSAIFLFDLKAIRKRLGPKNPVLNVLCGTAAGPPIHVPPAPVGFSWTVVFSTYKSGTFKSFLVPAKWPAPFASITMHSAAGTPVPGSNMDFAINLKDMKMTASRSDTGVPPPPPIPK
jgi:hypothetical protein